jgi:hypothetical protein
MPLLAETVDAHRPSRVSYFVTRGELSGGFCNERSQTGETRIIDREAVPHFPSNAGSGAG